MTIPPGGSGTVSGSTDISRRGFHPIRTLTFVMCARPAPVIGDIRTAPHRQRTTLDSRERVARRRQPASSPTSTAGHGSARCTPQVVAGTAPDTVLLLEHPPVYTAGKRTEAVGAPAGRHAGHRRRPRRQDHLARARPARRLPDRAAGRPDRRRRLRPADGGRAHRRLRRARRAGRQGRRTQRGVAAGRRRAAPTARSPRSASGWPAGVTLHGFALNCDPDLGAGSTASCRAASPTPASPR